MRVAPSPSLQNLRAVRAQVRFYWEPNVWGEKRHNLVEGHEAFALFMHPQGELRGTILNQAGDWEGAESAPGVTQFVSNCDRHNIVRALREAADRIERDEVIPR